MIPRIQPDDANPFAILSTGDGTYIQTLNTGDGYVLEYQLVNISSHYEVPELVSLQEVLGAFKSYASGTNDWLTDFAWQPQEFE